MQATVTMDKLLNLKDVAEILDVSEKTVRKLILKGIIQSKKVGLQFRFKREWIDQYLEE
jgi:excisionase family DNA binding protein